MRLKRAERLDESLNQTQELRKRDKQIQGQIREYDLSNPLKLHMDEESKEQNESVFYDLRPQESSSFLNSSLVTQNIY